MWDFVNELYSNVGTKMKHFIKIVFCINIVVVFLAVIVCEFVLFAETVDGEIEFFMFLVIGALIPLFGVIELFFAWLSSLLFFSMGEITERLEKISQNSEPQKTEANYQYVETSTQDTTNEKLAKLITPNKVEKTTTDAGHWICKSCGCKNLADRTTCWSCDKPKD